MRVNWAKRVAELLQQGGLLICLEFPMYKDPKLPGPPWGIKGVHWNLLARGGNGVVEEGAAGEQNSDSTVRQDKGQFNRILYIKPERSYESGRGTDMLSVYVRK
jgi:hypothetical protein